MLKKSLFFISLFLTLIALGACTPQAAEQNQARTVDKITVNLKWLHNPQFAGFYIAQRNNFYTEANLEVTFVAGGPGIDEFATVKDGTAHFGIGDGDDLIREVSNGANLVAIGATYQQTPYVFMMLRTEAGVDPLQTADDWRGKRVTAAASDIQLLGVLTNFGLTFDDVQIMPNSFEVSPLIDGETDIMGAFITDRGITLIDNGYDVQFVHPEEYGTAIYEDVIFTSKDLADSNPDLVQRFMNASIRGWQFAIENPNVAVESVIAFDPSADAESTIKTWEATVPLVDDEGALLRVESRVFESMLSLMQSTGAITNVLAPETYFTNRFIENAN